MKITLNDWNIAKTPGKKKSKRSGRGYRRDFICQGERIYNTNGAISCPFIANIVC